jgi:hypothetical protein
VIAQKYLGHQPWWAINHHIPSKITNICGKTAKRSWGIKRANFPKPLWDIHKIAKAKTTSGNFALSAGPQVQKKIMSGTPLPTIENLHSDVPP